jgi:hypothetical protein
LILLLLKLGTLYKKILLTSVTLQFSNIIVVECSFEICVEE